MEINIPLPNNFSINTYKELRGYFKQLELAIHHAQKAVDAAEESGLEIGESTYVCFQHPSLESALRIDMASEQNKEIAKTLDNFVDNYSEQLQAVELHISLN